MPYNFITVQAGTLLTQIDLDASIRQNGLILSGVAALVFLPGLILTKIQDYLNKWSVKPPKKPKSQ